MSHTVTVHFEDRTDAPSYDLTCTEPADAPCKAVWDCECEGYLNYEVRNGRPTHSAVFPSVGERCIGRFSPGACDVGAQFDADSGLFGEITFDVDFNGDCGGLAIVGGGVTR